MPLLGAVVSLDPDGSCPGVVDVWTARLLAIMIGSQLLLSVLLTLPLPVALQIGVMLLPASLAAGVGLMVDGRYEVIRRRMEAIRSNW